MWIKEYDDEGNEVVDPEQREILLLIEEGKRIKAFLNEVERVLDIESNGVEDFESVVHRLDRVRLRDPDRAAEAKRYLTQAAAIDADLYRHSKYIENNGFSINMADCMA